MHSIRAKPLLQHSCRCVKNPGLSSHAAGEWNMATTQNAMKTGQTIVRAICITYEKVEA